VVESVYKVRHFCNGIGKVLYKNLMKSPKIYYVQSTGTACLLSFSLYIFTAISMLVSLRRQKSFITSDAGSEARACHLLSP
jgi:hypothetical protein